jgi:nucleoid-associated protein YgaU
MRTETKIGVLIGLSVVVAASVYFARTGREESDVILSLTPEPKAAETKPAPTAAKSEMTGRRPLPTPGLQHQRATPTIPKPAANQERRASVPRIKGGPLGQQASREGTPQRATTEERQDRPALTPKRAAVETTPAGDAVVDSSQARLPRRTTPPLSAVTPPTEDESLLSRFARPKESTGESVQGESGTEPVEFVPLRTTSTEPVRPSPSAARGVEPSAVASEQRSPTGRGETTVESPVQRSNAGPAHGKASRGETTVEPPATQQPREYVVTAGDTLSGIARKIYGDTAMTDAILRANPQIVDPRRLQVGARLRLPSQQDARPPRGSAAAVERSPAGSGETASAKANTYVVRPGDSSLSRRSATGADGRRSFDSIDNSCAMIRLG